MLCNTSAGKSEFDAVALGARYKETIRPGNESVSYLVLFCELWLSSAELPANKPGYLLVVSPVGQLLSITIPRRFSPHLGGVAKDYPTRPWSLLGSATG